MKCQIDDDENLLESFDHGLIVAILRLQLLQLVQRLIESTLPFEFNIVIVACWCRCGIVECDQVEEADEPYDYENGQIETQAIRHSKSINYLKEKTKKTNYYKKNKQQSKFKQLLL